MGRIIPYMEIKHVPNHQPAIYFVGHFCWVPHWSPVTKPLVGMHPQSGHVQNGLNHSLYVQFKTGYVLSPKRNEVASIPTAAPNSSFWWPTYSSTKNCISNIQGPSRSKVAGVSPWLFTIRPGRWVEEDQAIGADQIQPCTTGLGG